ncbi:MAG: hypothetical protein ABI297_08505 [Ginsengibacter sp.]
MRSSFFVLFIVVFIFSACDKKGTNPDTNPQESYLNTNAGSSWTYHEDNSSGITPTSSNYTVTSTSRDSTISGRKYHIYDYSYGGSQYLSHSDNDYYQYDSITIAGNDYLQRLYLKDNLSSGANWSQNVNLTISNIPVTLVISNTIAEKGINKTVNGINYTNVTHVTSNLTSVLIPAGLSSNIDSYYAPNYGLIENTTIVKLNFLGLSENVNVTTKLMSANLK